MVTTGSLWLSGVSSGSQFNATKVNGIHPIRSSMCQVEFNLSEQNIVQCEISPFSPKRKGAQLLTTHFSMKVFIYFLSLIYIYNISLSMTESMFGVFFNNVCVYIYSVHFF